MKSWDGEENPLVVPRIGPDRQDLDAIAGHRPTPNSCNEECPRGTSESRSLIRPLSTAENAFAYETGDPRLRHAGIGEGLRPADAASSRREARSPSLRPRRAIPAGRCSSARAPEGDRAAAARRGVGRMSLLGKDMRKSPLTGAPLPKRAPVASTITLKTVAGQVGGQTGAQVVQGVSGITVSLGSGSPRGGMWSSGP
jgi:hypothetical protein